MDAPDPTRTDLLCRNTSITRSSRRYRFKSSSTRVPRLSLDGHLQLVAPHGRRHGRQLWVESRGGERDGRDLLFGRTSNVVEFRFPQQPYAGTLAGDHADGHVSEQRKRRGGRALVAIGICTSSIFVLSIVVLQGLSSPNYT